MQSSRMCPQSIYRQNLYIVLQQRYGGPELFRANYADPIMAPLACARIKQAANNDIGSTKSLISATGFNKL